MPTKKITLNELRSIVKQIIKENTNFQKPTKGFIIVKHEPLTDGYSKVVAVNRHGFAEEYMMKTDSVDNVGEKEFKAYEGYASNTNMNGYIKVLDQVYPLHRQYKTLENPTVI